MSKNKSRINRPEEPLETVIYGALMYCLYLCEEQREHEVENICEWCIPKLQFMSTEVLENIKAKTEGREKRSMAWAELVRVLILELENRHPKVEEEGKGEETNEMCVQTSPLSEEA